MKFQVTGKTTYQDLRFAQGLSCNISLCYHPSERSSWDSLQVFCSRSCLYLSSPLISTIRMLASDKMSRWRWGASARFTICKANIQARIPTRVSLASYSCFDQPRTQQPLPTSQLGLCWQESGAAISLPLLDAPRRKKESSSIIR